MKARPPRTLFAIVALAIAAAGAPRRSSGAEGDAASPLAAPGQRLFAVGPTAGVWAGTGAIAGGGGEAVKAWLSGGYMPVFVFANSRSADRAMRFNYYGAYQLNGDVTVRLLARARTDLGLLLGYKFNSVLGHGGGAGVRILYDVSERVALEIAAGLAVFPSAQDRLDRQFGYPTDRTPALTTALQGGANVGLLVFP